MIVLLCRASSVFFLLCCTSCFRCLAVKMGRYCPTQTKHWLFLCSICMFCSWLLRERRGQCWDNQSISSAKTTATFLWPYEADQLKKTLHHAMKQLREVLHDITMLEFTYFLLASGDVGVLHTNEGVPVTAWLPEASLLSCRHTQEIRLQFDSWKQSGPWKRPSRTRRDDIELGFILGRVEIMNVLKGPVVVECVDETQ